MSLRIQTNVEAFNAQRHLSATTDKIATAMERLSSGYRINRAADDAAGLSISEKLQAQINGLDQASRNSQDAVSLVQTAEGSLDEVHEMLQRVRKSWLQRTGVDEVAPYDRALEGVLDSKRILLPANRVVEMDRMARFAAELKQPYLLYGMREAYRDEAAPILKKNSVSLMTLPMFSKEAKALNFCSTVMAADGFM